MESVVHFSPQEFCLSPEERRRRHDVHNAVNQLATLVKLVQEQSSAFNSDIVHTRDIIASANQAITTLKHHLKPR